MSPDTKTSLKALVIPQKNGWASSFYQYMTTTKGFAPKFTTGTDVHSSIFPLKLFILYSAKPPPHTPSVFSSCINFSDMHYTSICLDGSPYNYWLTHVDIYPAFFTIDKLTSGRLTVMKCFLIIFVRTNQTSLSNTATFSAQSSPT